jgi:NADP-dependent 3-hydroxy acid dehydrogenase YdfG
MSTNTESHEVPEEFTKVVYDLVNDILLTFPEFKEGLNLDLHNIKETKDEDSVQAVYEHVKRVYPARFFDILYKNEDMYSNDDVNTEFLPGIDFKQIWSIDDVSDSTKETIWKYLQLILFSVIGKVDSQDSFGDTAKLFEAINEDELKQKLEETMSNLQNMMENGGLSGNEPIDVTGIDMDKLPNPDDIQGHINGLLDGKLGNLAKEIAEETAADLNIDMENATSVNDVFQNLFKNPGKLMGLVQSVGGKLDSKIKSGELNEQELMQEASQLLGKMKDMPGMGDIQSMMQNMGMGGRGSGGLDSMLASMGGLGGLAGLAGGLGGGKLNLAAMSNKLNQDMKKMENRQRMMERANAKRAEMEKIKLEKAKMAALPPTKQLTDEEMEELVFSIEGDKPEKSMKSDKPVNSSNKNKKKKKGKK